MRIIGIFLIICNAGFISSTVGLLGFRDFAAQFQLCKFWAILLELVSGFCGLRRASFGFCPTCRDQRPEEIVLVLWDSLGGWVFV